MNSKSNLAFAIEPEVLESAALNAVELDTLLRLSSHQADVSPRSRARGRNAAVSFKDNHSTAFRPFRVY